MLSVIYAECHIQAALYAECHYVECHYAYCRSAFCLAASIDQDGNTKHKQAPKFKCGSNTVGIVVLAFVFTCIFILHQGMYDIFMT